MRHPLAWALALSLVFFACYFYRISISDQPYWDEAIYLNAARAYLEGSKPYPNPEHPPLGKLLIATGVKLWGDRPEGWRGFAALAGALSGTLLVGLVFRFTRRAGVALFTGLLFLLDPLLYVHFRLGMLDPTLLVFLLGATAVALRFWESETMALRWLYAMGLLLGLALATKMLVLMLMPIFWIFVLARCRREWRSLSLWIALATSAILIPVAIYFLSYRILGYGFAETWQLTRYNFAFHQFHRGAQVMASRWYEWLYVAKPVWYYYRLLSDGQVQAVLGTGNLVLWIGAELLALYAWFRKRRDPRVWLIVALILVQFGLYVFKPVTFLQYMITILPFLYLLMGIGIGDLFDRFGTKYLRILQFDFACFFLGALFVFWNYLPYIHGTPMSREAFQAVNAATPPPALSQ